MSDFRNEWAFDAPPSPKETSKSVPQWSMVLIYNPFLRSKFRNKRSLISLIGASYPGPNAG